MENSSVTYSNESVPAGLALCISEGAFGQSEVNLCHSSGGTLRALFRLIDHNHHMHSDIPSLYEIMQRAGHECVLSICFHKSFHVASDQT